MPTRRPADGWARDAQAKLITGHGPPTGPAARRRALVHASALSARNPSLAPTR